MSAEFPFFEQTILVKKSHTPAGTSFPCPRCGRMIYPISFQDYLGRDRGVIDCPYCNLKKNVRYIYV